MAIYSGPEIPSSGLVFNVDPANPKNFGLNSVEVLVVGGGGAGAQDFAGGGGGGGVVYNSNFTVTPGSALTVTVGAGGARPTSGSNQGAGTTAQGSNSVFGSITANGGGAGAGSAATPNAGNGGSGGGGGSGKTAGTGTAGQGFAGASTASGVGGGGGGAGGPGLTTGAGGPGLQYNISGTPTFYGGGGGGTNDVNFAAPGGVGGGGTNGGFQAASNNGVVNTGGGGSAYYGAWGGAGNGGSGIVIVRYNGPQRAIGGAVTRVGNDTVHTFTSIGSTTFTPLGSSTITGLADFAGTSKFATAYNAPTFSSTHITFDGSDDYFLIPTINLGNGNLPWTASAWVKTTTTVNVLGNGSIFSNFSSGPVYSAMCVNNGKIAYWTYQSSAWSQKLGVKTVNDNVWHMLTWVNFSNSTMKLYVDGVFDADVANSTSGNNNPIDVFGGSWNSKFQGSIGPAQIYNRSLNPVEILELFEASRDRYGV